MVCPSDRSTLRLSSVSTTLCVRGRSIPTTKVFIPAPYRGRRMVGMNLAKTDVDVQRRVPMRIIPDSLKGLHKWSCLRLESWKKLSRIDPHPRVHLVSYSVASTPVRSRPASGDNVALAGPTCERVITRLASRVLPLERLSLTGRINRQLACFLTHSGFDRPSLLVGELTASGAASTLRKPSVFADFEGPVTRGDKGIEATIGFPEL